MGRVYRAFDPLVRRVVAVKTVKSDSLDKETRRDYLGRFQREAQAAGRLSHPHIVNVFDVGENYIVMELLDGQTLAELLSERAFGIEEALGILWPVAEAIDYAHAAGVIHRDIKPGNIMILPGGRPKLMDFGVARLDMGSVSAGEGYLGSPCYMAPEQMRSGDVTGRADLFSFGVVGYEILTGHRPFQGDSITAIVHRVVNENPPAARSLRPDLPPAYDSIFARALAKDPAQRFPTAVALVTALMKEITSSHSEDVPTGLGAVWPSRDRESDTLPVSSHGEPGARRRRGLWAALLLAVLGAAATIPLLLRQDPPTLVARGELRIETEPEGASVWVDGLAVGRSPLSLKGIAPGPHQVRVSADGHAPAELRLQVAAGMATPPLRFVLAPTGALLAVRTEPAGAVVLLDGRSLGVTPLEAGLVRPGPHALRIERKGYVAEVRRIEAETGQPLVIEARLEPIPVGRAPAKAGLPPALVKGSLVQLDASVTPPRRTSGDPAPYPEAARRLKLEGSVTIEMTVTETGTVRDIRILASAGTVLDDAVIKAVEQWRFQPARKKGVNVRVRWKYRQTFRPTA